MAEGDPTASQRSSEDWDAALQRLLQDVKLDELHVLRTDGAPSRRRLTFDAVREAVAQQLQGKIQAEEQRRRALAHLQMKFREASGQVDDVLARFAATLLGSFHGGGEVQTQAELKGKTWKVLAARTQTARGGSPDPVITVTLTMRGTDPLDRGTPALECRVSTARNPRLADFTVGEGFPLDLEDAICRAYQDIVGTLRFSPDALKPK